MSCHDLYTTMSCFFRHDETVKKNRGQPKTTLPTYEIVPDFKPAEKDEQHYKVVQAYKETKVNERVAETYHDSDSQLSSESRSCEKLHIIEPEEKIESVKPTEVKDEPNYKVVQTYERIQSYERAQAYEKVHHNDAQLPKQLMSELTLSETRSVELTNFKPAQVLVPSKDEANCNVDEKEQSYERAQTYEKVHHNDAQLPKQLMSELTSSGTRSEEITNFKPAQVLVPSKDEANCNVDEKEQSYERAQTYERTHHNDAQLPKKLMSGLEELSETLSEEISDFKPIQVPTTDEANYKVDEKEQNYERAQSYERIHLDDTQLIKQLLPGFACEKLSRIKNDEYHDN